MTGVVGRPRAEWPELLELLRAAFSGARREQRAELAAVLVDVVWVVDLQYDAGEGGGLPAERQALADLVLHAMERQYVAPALAKERLDQELLEAAQAIQSGEVFYKKQVRINTVMLYKQQKFNLLREETEGFAKLLVLLLDWVPRAGEPADALFHKVISLIGYFELDPNRVLDVVLDEFAFALGKHAMFVGLLRAFAFPAATLASILGFKLQFLATQRDAEAADGLLAVVAHLLRAGLLALEQVYPALAPADDECRAAIAQREQDIVAASRRVGLVSLAAKPADERKDSEPAGALGFQDVPGHLAAFQAPENQKAALIAALLEVGELDRARALLARLPGIAALNSRIARAICAHVRAALDGLDGPAALRLAGAWLALAGPGLYLDGLLFCRLCRLARPLLAAGEPAAAALVVQQLLPALSLSTANPALAHELWGLLQVLPYAQRFSLYHAWRTSVYEAASELRYCRAQTANDIRRVMRRLAKENVKQLGRLIGKLAHGNPAVFFPVVLDQLQAYDNLVQPVVDSLKFLTPLGFDVLTCMAAGGCAVR